MSTLYSRLALFTAVFTLVVIMLGAYVRLSHAGLGCPDWPGCYGRILVPEEATAVAQANAAYPERPLESAKAWKEMAHRYFAGTLGLLVLAIAIIAVRYREELQQSPKLPLALLALVIFQAALGMWTVTLLLKPAIVTLHLLAGMTTLILLAWLTLSRIETLKPTSLSASSPPRTWGILAFVVVFIQVALGGWTSTNYAALHCPDFPVCHGQWWPTMDFSTAFNIFRPIGIDYEGGRLSFEAGVAVHLTHRIGATIVLMVVGGLALKLMSTPGNALLRKLGVGLLIVLLTQIALGISNVLFQLPLPIAVLHNGVAALLLVTLLTVIYCLSPRRQLT